MSEEVWFHALQFLDKYSRRIPDEEDERSKEFYSFENDDATGILDRHR